MSKNTQISELINYLSYDGSGNIVFNTVSSATTNTDKFLVSDTGVLKFRTAAQLLSDIGAQASGSYQTALSGTGFVKISGSTISYDNSTYATETYVGTAISNLVASSPATLDTLNELALALGSDPNFATTVATSIGTKQAQLNGTGFVKITGTTISYDNSTYLTTGTASSTYLTTTTAGTTYVPYTGANADVVLGTNNLKSKNTFAEGDGLYNGGGLRIKQYAFQTDGIDGYNTISSQTSGFAFSSSRGSGVFNNFILDPTSLPNNTQRSYILPNANGTLALTTDLSSYLPLAGGTLTGALSTNSPIYSSSGTPLTFTNNGNSGTYTQTTIYVNQNNTSGNTANGIFIERGKISDAGGAETRHFVIGARGGSIQWLLDGSGSSSQTGNMSAVDVYATGAVRYNGAGLNASDKKLYSPVDGELQWMTHSNAGAHAFSISHQGTRQVYLDVSGNSYFTGGNLGIGLNNPSQKLHVAGNIYSTDTVFGRNLKPEAFAGPAAGSPTGASIPIGYSTINISSLCDNSWRTIMSQIGDSKIFMWVALGDAASKNTGYYTWQMTSPAYGVANFTNIHYLSGGWNTGGFEFTYDASGGNYRLLVRTTSYYSAGNTAYGTIYFLRLE